MTTNNTPLDGETKDPKKFFTDRQSEVNTSNYNKMINEKNMDEQILEEIRKTNSHLENILKKLDEITNYFKPQE